MSKREEQQSGSETQTGSNPFLELAQERGII